MMASKIRKMRGQTRQKTKRGDTVIEVMLAFAIFSAVAILSVGMMNRGLNSAETALELSTARNEINAQAEALRFIHNSYNTGGGSLWEKIVSEAIELGKAQKVGIIDLADYILQPNEDGVAGCQKVYDGMRTISNADEETFAPLQEVNAFVLNTHKINLNSKLDEDSEDLKNQYISTTDLDQAKKFQTSPLGARIVYGGVADDKLSDTGYIGSYRDDTVARVEGIWVYAVKSAKDNNSEPIYYDFYIDACWYGAGARTPTTIDTVIRLYNPEAM